MLRWTSQNLTLFPPEDLDQVRAAAEFLATDHGPATVVESDSGFVFVPSEVLAGLRPVMVALSANTPVVIEPISLAGYSNPAGLPHITVDPPSNWRDASQVAHFLNTDNPEPVALVAADGTRVDLPPEARLALLKVAMSLSGLDSVTLAPISYHPSIEEAEQLLGPSLEPVTGYALDGTVTTQQPPHDSERPLDLRDVVNHQERFLAFRREGLAQMRREAEEQGLYEKQFPMSEILRIAKEERRKRLQEGETDL